MTNLRFACGCATLLVVAGGNSACGPACADNNVGNSSAPPVITVINAATGQAICDANVVAQSSAGPLVTVNDMRACTEAPLACPDASVQLITFVDQDASTSCAYGIPVREADGSVDGIGPAFGPPFTLRVSQSGFKNA